MKRILSIVLAITLFLCSTPLVNASAYEIVDENMDSELSTIDLLIAAFMNMYSTDETRNIWPDEVIVEHQIPLYSLNGQKVAWYIEFTSGAYAIINNNKENPAVIEFGSQPNMLISNIYNSSANYHIIYNGPMQIYNHIAAPAEIMTDTENVDLYSYYPELSVANNLLLSSFTYYSNIINSILEQAVMPLNSYDDYGFIPWSQLPQQSSTSNNLPYVNSVDWAIMNDYVDPDNPSYAYNHCGAVCVTNLAIYLSLAGRPELMIAGDKDLTFYSVHCYVPNGPVGVIKNYAYDYFYDCGYILRYSSISTFSDIVDAIDDEHPCSMLLANELLDWHWVMAVGYVSYSNSQHYVRIVTGWNTSASYYYLFNSSSLFYSGEEYWIG